MVEKLQGEKVRGAGGSAGGGEGDQFREFGRSVGVSGDGGAVAAAAAAAGADGLASTARETAELLAENRRLKQQLESATDSLIRGGAAATRPRFSST